MKTGITLFVVFILVASSFLFFQNQLKNSLEKETDLYMFEVADRDAKLLKEKVEGDLDMLSSMALVLGNLETIDVDQWIDTLGEDPLFDEFQKFGFILPNGRAYTLDLHDEDYSDRDYVKRVMAGETAISDVMVDKKNLPYISYLVPIFKDKEVIGSIVKWVIG